MWVWDCLIVGNMWVFGVWESGIVRCRVINGRCSFLGSVRYCLLVS
jgi:hypothetical protein